MILRLLLLTVTALNVACAVYDGTLVSERSSSSTNEMARAGAAASNVAGTGGRPATGAVATPVGMGGADTASGSAEGGGRVETSEPEVLAGASGSGPMPGSSGEPPALPQGSGTVTHERWLDVPGSAISDFPSDPPDEVIEVTSLKAPATTALDYADRLRGYITAPLDGEYRFWLACDDNGELWLSTDDSPSNKELVASLSGIDRWTSPDEWGKFASQESRLIRLEAGQRYYVEALVKQGIGESTLSVGWLKPGDEGTLPSEVVPGSQLSPIER